MMNFKLLPFVEKISVVVFGGLIISGFNSLTSIDVKLTEIKGNQERLEETIGIEVKHLKERVDRLERIGE